jgi:hypothetical protein
MPGYSYGLDAFVCRRGSQLALEADTPCAKCYARRNFYATWTPVVKNRRAHQAAIHGRHWADAMVRLLEHYLLPVGERWFRMHDSGDLRDITHLGKIVDVARRTPWLSYWLPTHEPFIVAEYRATHGTDAFPPNLVVRLSADHDDLPPSWPGRVAGMTRAEVAIVLAGLPTSTTNTVVGRPVQVDAVRRHSVECLAHTRGHQCGSCRACWSPLVRNVSYPISGGEAASGRARRAAGLRVLA